MSLSCVGCCCGGRVGFKLVAKQMFRRIRSATFPANVEFLESPYPDQVWYSVSMVVIIAVKESSSGCG